MIVVDTSAILAILKDEPSGSDCLSALDRDDRVLMSAGTLAELLIVAAGRNVIEEVETLLRTLSVEVRPVTAADASRIGHSYRRWGKGMHPAALNYGDCFSYVLATGENCPLLYVGNDFARTDVTSALA